ncbi:MAG: metal-dependent hydrolase, partial [Gemmatimonadaceae bacterium]
CALLWPFSNVRYFAPWRPIPVAPIGLDFLSERGLRVALTELAIFSIPLLYGVWPRRDQG